MQVQAVNNTNRNYNNPNFGNAKVVDGCKIKTAVRKGVPQIDNRSYQEIMGLGKPKWGFISGWEWMNEIYEKIKRGEELTDFEKLYFGETNCAISSSLAKEEYEELFGPLT